MRIKKEGLSAVSGIQAGLIEPTDSRENFAYGARSRNPGRARPDEFQDSREKVAYGQIQEKILHMGTCTGIPVASDRPKICQ